VSDIGAWIWTHGGEVQHVIVDKALDPDLIPGDSHLHFELLQPFPFLLKGEIVAHGSPDKPCCLADLLQVDVFALALFHPACDLGPHCLSLCPPLAKVLCPLVEPLTPNSLCNTRHVGIGCQAEEFLRFLIQSLLDAHEMGEFFQIAAMRFLPRFFGWAFPGFRIAKAINNSPPYEVLEWTSFQVDSMARIFVGVGEPAPLPRTIISDSAVSICPMVVITAEATVHHRAE
jgi:hypothetical protein